MRETPCDLRVFPEVICDAEEERSLPRIRPRFIQPVQFNGVRLGQFVTFVRLVWFVNGHRRLRVCSAAALRGALLAHAAWCATRTRLWLVSCYSPIAREQLVTMKRSPCVLCSSLFGNSLYAGLTLRARATRGLRRPTSGYRPYVGRLYGPRRSWLPLREVTFVHGTSCVAQFWAEPSKMASPRQQHLLLHLGVGWHYQPWRQLRSGAFQPAQELRHRERVFRARLRCHAAPP